MVLAVVLATAGCGGSVELATPDLSPGESRACAALVAALPDTLAGESATETEPEGAPGAAWGDPPLVLQCGAPIPEEFVETSECLVVDDVGWFVPPEQEADPNADVEFTAVGYEPAVRLSIPAEHRGATSAAALAELAAPVTEHLELVQPCL